MKTCLSDAIPLTNKKKLDIAPHAIFVLRIPEDCLGAKRSWFLKSFEDLYAGHCAIPMLVLEGCICHTPLRQPETLSEERCGYRRILLARFLNHGAEDVEKTSFQAQLGRCR